MGEIITRMKVRYRRYATCCSCFVILMSFQGCKSQEADSFWTAAPMIVDGKLNDWVDIPVMYYEKENVGVGICNDSENIYIAVKFRNPVYGRLIRMGGLNVWIDRSAEKSEDFGLIYNDAPEMEQMKRPRQAEAGDDRFGAMPERPAFEDHNPVTLRLVDKKSIFQEAIIASDGSEGPRAACDTSQSFFVYEFSLPLRESESRYYGIGTAVGSKIMIGLKMGASEMKRERPGGFGGDRGGMGGGPGGSGGMGGPGGSMGGVPGGGQHPDRGASQEAQKVELWLTTTLAGYQMEPDKK